MSNAPTGFQTPRTDWASGNIPTPADFNRAEGNSAAIETGSRTLDQALANPANVGTLRQILSWFAGRIRAITGATNWWDAPAISLADTNSRLTDLALTTGTGEARGVRRVTASTSAPSGGTDGDVWLRYT